MPKTKQTVQKRQSSALTRVQKLFPHVTSMVDANSDIDIRVTKSDTQTKAVKNHSECALAHACRRSFQADGAMINVTSAYIIKGNTATRYKLPESVSREIVSFDREAAFEPGDYHLHTPPPSSRLGTPQRTGSRGGYVKGAGKRVQPHHLTENVRRVGDLNP